MSSDGDISGGKDAKSPLQQQGLMQQQALTRRHRFLARIYPYAMWVRNPLRHRLGQASIGVCALIHNAAGEVLLVKHSYRPGWCLPGGGLKRGEVPVAALTRELREEVGLELIGMPQIRQVYLQAWFGMADYPILFAVDAARDVRGTAHVADLTEIVEIRWWPMRALPVDTDAATRRRMEEWLGDRPLEARW